MGGHAGYNADKVSVTRLNYVGNYLVPGPNSAPNGKAYATGSPYNKSYFAENHYAGERPNDQWKLVKFNQAWTDEQIAGYKKSKPFETGPVNTMDAQVAYREILESGGAILPKRDDVDKRVVKDVRSRKGKIINSQQEVGGWPQLKSREAPKDTDGDGIPDYWEDRNNLDKFNPKDRNNVGADGYTMLEKYLNSIK